MEEFFKELKKKFHRVSFKIYDDIEVENLTDIRSFSHFDFDIVFRDKNKNILFLGYVSPISLNDFLDENNKTYDFVDFINQDVFLFFIEEKKVLKLNRYKQSITIPYYEIDEFIIKIKNEFPSSRNEIENLQYEISSIKNQFQTEKKELLDEKQKIEIQHSKIKKDLEQSIRILQDVIKSKEEIIKKLEYQNSIVREDVLFKLRLKLKEINFIEISNKIYKPIPSDFHSHTPTSSGPIRQIIGTSNIIVNEYFTIFKDNVYYLIETYDKYDEGRNGTPETILSDSMYYSLDKNSLTFFEIEKLDFNYWISKYNFTK